MSSYTQGRKRAFRASWAGLSLDQNTQFLDLRESVAPWLTANSADEFLQSLDLPAIQPAHENAPPQEELKSAAHIAREFHARAGTLSAAVQNEINAYQGGAPTFRVAHQPNFMPSVNVVAQAALCDIFARSRLERSCQVFVLVDYDVNTDRRYRHALFPSISAHNGFRSLSAPPMHHDGETLIFADTKPLRTFAADTLKVVSALVRQDLGVIRHGFNDHSISRYRLSCGEAVFAEHFTEAFQRGHNLADANAIFLSRIVNLVLGLPTIFLPGHKLLRLLTAQFEQFWSESENLAEASSAAAKLLEVADLTVGGSLVCDTSTAPFWFLCKKCDSRLPLRWIKLGDQARADTCKRCSSSPFVICAKDLAELLQVPDHPRIIPRVVLDDLLDGVAWRHIAGSSYRGGLEHYIFSAVVAQHMGLRALPEFFSQRQPSAGLSGLVPSAYVKALDSTDNRKSTHELLASGRASIAHTLLWEGGLTADTLAQGFLAR